MPKLTNSIQEWPISKLVPYPRNPRKNDEVVEQMMVVLKEFGFKIPMLAKSDGSVVDGHLRLKAAQRMGLKTVPVLLCDEWSDEQVKAFRLLVNRSATWAEWDADLLSLELQELKASDFDLALTGFGDQEIAQLFLATSTEPPQWDGMPDFHQEDQLAYHTVKVHFADDAAIEEFAKLVGQKLTKQTRFIWYPQAEKAIVADKRFISKEQQPSQ
jgi:ParB-like nuclease domain